MKTLSKPVVNAFLAYKGWPGVSAIGTYMQVIIGIVGVSVAIMTYVLMQNTLENDKPSNQEVSSAIARSFTEPVVPASAGIPIIVSEKIHQQRALSEELIRFDVNQNGRLDFADIVKMYESYGQRSEDLDVNGNGVIDIAEVEYLFSLVIGS